MQLQMLTIPANYVCCRLQQVSAQCTRADLQQHNSLHSLSGRTAEVGCAYHETALENHTPHSKWKV
jgi:hypothetical protein